MKSVSITYDGYLQHERRIPTEAELIVSFVPDEGRVFQLPLAHWRQLRTVTWQQDVEIELLIEDILAGRAE